MIHQAIDQLIKIRCTEYEGDNAEALREMDLSELERLLYGVRDQEDKATEWADGVRQDVSELENSVKEFSEFMDNFSNVKNSVANVKRHMV